MRTLHRFLTPSVALLVLFGSLLAGGTRLQAATIYTLNQSFDLPHNGLPTGWSGISSVVDASTIAITEVTSGDEDWRLLLRRDASASQTVYYTGSEGPIANGQIANFNSSVVFRSAGTTANYARGILARAQPTSGVYFNGYFSYVESNVLYISKDPKSSATKGTPLGDGIALSEGLAINTDYQFNFSAIGDQLTASIYKKDEGSANFTIELATKSVTDSSYSTGCFGFRNMPDGKGRGTYFSDLKIEVIPEPSTTALSLAAVVLLLLRCPLAGLLLQTENALIARGNRRESMPMCVIAGYIGNQPAAPILLKMLEREEGLAGGFYTGIATVQGGRLHHEKVVGDVATLLKETAALELPGTVGIAHGRSPSGGGREWGHPFVDTGDRLAYIANGSVGKYDNLPLLAAACEKLAKVGHRFRSEQTEPVESYPVLSNGVSVHFSDLMCQAVAEAFKPLANAPDGLLRAAIEAYETYPGELVGLCLHAARPDEIVVVRHNKPLEIGRDGEGGLYLASTSLAFPEGVAWQMRMPPASGAAIRREGTIQVNPFTAKGLIPLGSHPSATAIEEHLVGLIRREGPRNMEQLFDAALPLYPKEVLVEKEIVVFEMLASLLAEGRIELIHRRRTGMFGEGTVPWTWVAWRK